MTSAVCCFDQPLFSADNLVWGKNFAVVLICVRATGLHDQGGRVEVVRMLNADILTCHSVLQTVLVFTGLPFVVTGIDYVKREKIMMV